MGYYSGYPRRTNGVQEIGGSNPAPDMIIGDEAFATDSSAVAVMNSVYGNLSHLLSFAKGSNSLGQLTGLTGDEMAVGNGDSRVSFYTNTLKALNFSDADL